MKYPIINQKSVNSAIKHFEDRLKNLSSEERPYEAEFIYGHINHLRNLKSELSEFNNKYYNANENLIVNIRACNIFPLTLYAREIIDKLLGDTKIRKSLVFIYDGSYVGNRILLYMDFDGIIDVRLEIDQNLVSTSDLKDYSSILSTKKKIDWMYNHFDKVFVQLSPELIEYSKFQYSFSHARRVYDTSCEAVYMDN